MTTVLAQTKIAYLSKVIHLSSKKGQSRQTSIEGKQIAMQQNVPELQALNDKLAERHGVSYGPIK